MPRTPDFSFAGSKKRNIGVVFSILMSVMGVSMLQETKFDPLRIALKVWAICSKYSGFSAILASILRMRSTLGSRNKNALPPPPFMPSPTITAAQAPLLSRRARKIKSQIKSNKDASASKKVPLKDLYGVVVDSSEEEEIVSGDSSSSSSSASQDDSEVDGSGSEERNKSPTFNNESGSDTLQDITLGARAKDFMDGVNGSNSFQQGSQGSQVADTHKIVNGFDLWKRIGKGSFGEVWMVTKKNEGDVYAMKILEKEHLLKLNVPQRAVSEKKILQKINSPFVISLKWAFQDKKHLYLVLDYVGGGDLFHLYRRVAPNCFSEAAARFYAVELSLALEHLHQQDIVFRDLKLENVLVGLDGHIKLTDFGVAKQSLFRSHTFVGTPQYMAPEIIHRKPHGAEVDWWAMGVLLYELLCGDLPFQYSDASSLFPNTDQAIFFPPELRLSKACQHFVRSLLEPSQEKRLGSQGADQVKGHSFFQGIDWKVAASKGLEPPLLPQDNNSNALDKDSFNADTEETDDFRTFTIYDSYLNRQELIGQQKMLASKAIHPFFDTPDNDIAEMLSSEIVDASAVCYLQGTLFLGHGGYLDYRRQVRRRCKELVCKVLGVTFEGEGHVTVTWEIQGRMVLGDTHNGTRKMSQGLHPGVGPEIISAEEAKARGKTNQLDAECITLKGVTSFTFKGLKAVRIMNSYDTLGMQEWAQRVHMQRLPSSSFLKASTHTASASTTPSTTAEATPLDRIQASIAAKESSTGRAADKGRGSLRKRDSSKESNQDAPESSNVFVVGVDDDEENDLTKQQFFSYAAVVARSPNSLQPVAVLPAKLGSQSDCQAEKSPDT